MKAITVIVSQFKNSASGRPSRGVQVFLFFLICSAVYSLVAWDRNFAQSRWHQHVLFADAYIQGELGVDVKKFELQRVGDKFYNPQGPMPAILMMPLALVFGARTSDYSFAVFLSAAAAALFMLALFSLKEPYIRSDSEVWAYSVLFAFGTIQFAYAVNGTFWFLSQLTAVFFVVLFLLMWFRFGKRPWGPFLVGLAIGASLLARYHAIILSGAFGIYVLFEKGIPLKRKALRLALFGAGVAVFAGAALLHNYLRFGGAVETGYAAFNKGSYFEFDKIGPHLSCVFFAMPILLDKFPYIAFSGDGLSMLLLTPLYFYLLRIRYSTLLQRSVGITCLLFFAFIMGYHTNGSVQFGYRYFLEFNPLLILLLALASDQIPRKKLFYTLSAFGAVLNAVGGFALWRTSIHELFFVGKSFINNLNY